MISECTGKILIENWIFFIDIYFNSNHYHIFKQVGICQDIRKNTDYDNSLILCWENHH